jgi:UDP-N-acetylglucosamine 2-epimerase
VSSLLFAPTDAALANLAAEGVRTGVVRTGDVMFDVVERHREAIASRAGEVCRHHGLTRGGFAFATVHRAENTDTQHAGPAS